MNKKNPIELFKEIAGIPRCSKNASKMKNFLVDFAKGLDFEVLVDNFGNILCKKGENQKVALQAHYDMVCIGDVENLEILEVDGFLKAKRSSLGADNAIGVSYMLSLMQERDNIEYLFTADEEIGLIGARNLELNLNAKYLINTDTENEEDISIGCAGGFDLYAKYKIELIKSNLSFTYRLKTKNFKGGHSGVDIDKKIKNAIKEAFFLLSTIKGVKLIEIDGGEKLNSIPKDVNIIFALEKPLEVDYDRDIFEIERVENRDSFIANSPKIIDIFTSLPSGVLGYDKDFSVVDNSINFSKVSQKESHLEIEMMGRANNNELLEQNFKSICSMLNLFGFIDIESGERFSAWNHKRGKLSEIARDLFREVLGRGEFKVIHAGFECGVLGEKFPHMDMISIGPNIYNPHSLEERVEIESINRVYDALCMLLNHKLLSS